MKDGIVKIVVKYGKELVKEFSYNVFPKLRLLSIYDDGYVVAFYCLQLTRNVHVGCALFRFCDYLAMEIESWL